MKKIYLIRHCEAEKYSFLNSKDYNADQKKNEKISLSKVGEDIANSMANKIFNSNIAMIWSSTYERAILTAKPIASVNNLKINISNEFNERKLGNTTGIKEEFWLTQLNDENAKTVGGESRKEVTKRMLKGLYKVLSKINENDSAIIVSHATSITFLLMKWCKLKDADLKSKKRWLIFNNKDVINILLILLKYLKWNLMGIN